ncbi:carboxypeptidase-like regulatory domain-containing protein [Flavobacterium sp.]
MKGEQEDILSMEILIHDYIKALPPEKLEKLPGIVEINTTFGENVTMLRACRNGQVLNRTGNRLSKDALREEMSSLGFTVAAEVCAYALAIDNKVLQMKVTYVYSDLENMRDTDVADACSSIHEIALVHIAALADYDTTPASLVELKESIELYNIMLPKTREGINIQTSFTDRIKEIFAENQDLLFRMDKLATMRKFKDPQFHSHFFKARKIVNTGGRKLSMRGTITNELGQPIEKVLITVELPHEAATKSTARGNYRFKGIPAGVYPVTFKRDGFETLKQFVVFTPTLRVDLNIMLKAEQLQQKSA